MKKIAIGLVAALLLALAGGWYWFSPQIALAGLRDAAEAGDKEAVMSYIDLPSVRASMKEEATHLLVEQARKGTDSNIGIGLGSAIVDMAVDRFVTEENIAAVVQNPSLAAGVVNPYVGQDHQPPDVTKADFSIVRGGLNQFRLVSAKEDGGALIFRRYGLGWKLAGVELPDQTF